MRREIHALKTLAAIVVAGVAAACGGSGDKPAESGQIVAQEVGEMSPEEAGGMAPVDEHAGHGAPMAPHGGRLVPMGSVAHLEFVLDPSSGLLTAYVLDGSGRQTMRVTAMSIPLQVTPSGGQAAALPLSSTANGLTGDTVGNSSQFGGTLPALKGVTSFTGVVTEFSAGGQTFKDVTFSYPSS